ncbi:hypothetical protein DPMN_165810 [Dreissena polymorpha]|uniref:Uncharacterized protein n=1 Tax=Dreissena polymorpha TaxID=45954 RepID=A0A9D4IXC2_DREPO|nr:hypothetical protein DPMN_165810 [Dreissena polymorpha]
MVHCCSTGVVGQPNNAQIDNYIMEKTMEWVQQRTMYGTMTENPEIIMSMQQGQSNPLAASLGPALGAGMGTGMEASNPLASMLGGSSAALLSLPSAAAAPGSSSSPSSMPGLLAALAASRGSSSMNPMIASLMMNNMAGSSGSGSSNTGGATSNPLMGLLSMGAIGMDLPMM